MLDVCACCLTENPGQSRTLVCYVDLLKRCFHMKFYLPKEESIVCDKCSRLLKKVEQFHSQMKVAQTFFRKLKYNKTKRKGIINGLSERTVKTDVGMGVPEAACAALEDIPILSTEGNTLKPEVAEALSTDAFTQIRPEQEESARFNEADGENLQDARTSNNATSTYNSAPQHKTKRTNVKYRLPYKLDSKDRTCPLCRKHFIFFRELSDHMHAHYPNHICHACGKLCATKQSLRSHVTTHHSTKHKCKHCAKEYSKSSTLKEHDRIAHKGERKTYSCAECKEAFATSHRRLMHGIEFHGYEEKRFKCKECDKRYNHGSHLRAHVRNEHRKEKKAQCELCVYTFFSRSALKNHMICHSKEKKYQCVHCAKLYLRSSTLKQHLKIHANKKEYVCEVCDKAFTQKVTLNKHLKTHKDSKSHETMNALSSMLKKL